MKTIYQRLSERFPQLYMVYNPAHDETNTFVLRVYLRNVMFKRAQDINETNILDVADQLKNTVIRGTPGITHASVTGVAHTYVKEDGSLDSQKMFAIETDGTNLSLILENKYLDIYECNTTSIEEIERMYGIEAARNKIVDELLTTEKNKANYEWATVYADEMSYNGRVTSIQRSGLGQRELNNVLLRASFGSPIQVLQNAAINNQTDTIQGMSGPMCLGMTPRFGTTFNNVIIDHDHVKRMTKSNAELISEI